MYIVNEDVIRNSTHKVVIVHNFVEKSNRAFMTKFGLEMRKYGIGLNEVCHVSLFDKPTKKFGVGELREAVKELEEFLKIVGCNVLVDNVEGFENKKTHNNYLFKKLLGRDTSKWRDMGILEDSLLPQGTKVKMVCGLRWGSIARESNSKGIIDSEFKLNVLDFDIQFIKDIDSAKVAFKEMAKSQRIYGDLETNSLRFERKDSKILTVAWTPKHKPLTSYVFAYDHPKVEVTKDYKQFIYKNVKAIMTKRNTVFHNSLFDQKFISRFFNVDPFDTDIDDTFVIARILKNNTLSSDERRESVSLKTLAFDLVGDWEVPLQKEKERIIKEKGISKDDFDYSMYEVKDLVHYAGIDTIVMPFVDDKLQKLNEEHPAPNPIKNCWEANWKEVTKGIIQLMLDGIPLNVEACKKMIKSHEEVLEKHFNTLKENNYVKSVESILRSEALEKAMIKYNDKVEKAKAKGKVFKGATPDPENKEKYDSIELNPKFKPSSSNHKHILIYDICKCSNPILVGEVNNGKFRQKKKYKTIQEAVRELDIPEMKLRRYLRGYNKNEISKGTFVRYEECTDTGLPKADDDQFIKYSKMYPENSILQLFSDIATKNKELGTYLRPWLGYAENSFDGRIHANFSPDTTSFRWASTDPNLQQIPKESEIRSVLGYSEDSDRVMMSQDFSQLEVLANINICKDRFSIDLFNKGIEDEHSVNLINASEVSEKFSAVKGLDPLNLEHLKRVKEEFGNLRKKIKSAVTFPMTYLASPMAVKMGLECTDDEAEGIWNSWWDARKGYRDWVNQTFQRFKNEGYSVVLGGLPILAEYNTDLDGIETLSDLMSAVEVARKNKQKDRVDYLKKVIKSFRTFVNVHGQSASLLTNQGMCRLIRWSKENNIDVKMANTVHDDLIVDVAIKDLDLVWRKQKEFMTMEYMENQELPMSTDAEIGKTIQYEIGNYEGENRDKLRKELKIE